MRTYFNDFYASALCDVFLKLFFSFIVILRVLLLFYYYYYYYYYRF